MRVESLEKYIKRKVKFAKERRDRLKERYGDTPNAEYNYHGGWNMGFVDGVYSSLDDLIELAEIKDLEISELRKENERLRKELANG